MGGDSLSAPILYEANATDFNNLGLGPLVDTTVATVTEERNGQFILEMQYPVDGIRASLIAKNRILKVDAGHKLKDQRFVIKRINRIMGNDGLSYSIYAEHISYITADYALKPNLTVNGSGNVAMTQWLNGIIDSNRIHVDSDITTENTTSWTIDKVQNARQALGGVQGSILDIWGGEYRFDNLNISLLRHRGTVSNTMLSYGRNITDFDQEENITNTYTSIYPFASYSVQNGDTSEQKILTIPNLVVDSEYVNNFPNRKIQVVDFSDKFSTDEKPTIERLAELAKSYIKNNNVGVPTVSTKISFVDLSKTENYKEFAPLEELDLCDEVPFAFEKFGIKTTAKISRIVWNVLLDSYDSLELGELKTNLSDVINNTNNAALDAKDAANDAKNSADNAALSANGKNRNWYGADDPTFGHLSELRDGDSWYMPNGEDTELYHWINGQWVFILSTKDTHEAKDAADTAQKEAEEAKKQANKAVDGANDAVAKAGFANDTATQAKSDAAAAGQQAKNALTSAGTAAADAATAIAKANSTASEFGRVDQNAGSALASALSAQSDASAAVIQASSAAAGSKDAKQIAGAVSQSYKTLTDGSTMTIAELESGLAVKLTKTDLDGYSTQTWTQNQIKMTADGINGTMSSIKSTVDGQTTSINDLKADSSSFKSQFTTVNNTLGKQTADIGTLQATSKELTTGFNTLTTDNGTNKNDISQLKQTATELNSTMMTVQTQVQNSAVGTNLYRDTRDYGNPTVWNNFGNWTKTGEVYDGMTVMSTTGDWCGLSQNWAVKKGETYTFSIYARYKSGTGESNIFTGPSNADIASMQYSLNETWQRISITFMATGAVLIAPKLERSNNNTNTLLIAGPKLERGSVMTDYSTSPLDNATVTALSKLSQTVNGIQTTVSGKADQSQITQLSGQISLKADTTALNELKGTVDKQGSEITLNTNSIKLKADQSSVNTLKGTVDKQGSAIDVNTKAIALKASQSTVDTLTGRVSTAEGKITVQADQISQTVSKTELTSKLNGYATQTWSEGKISAAKDEITASVQNMTSDMATQTWTQGKLDLTAKSFTSQISSVQKNVDNMQIGGRNLYLNSKAIEDGYGINGGVKVTVEPFDSTTNMWHIVAEQGIGATVGLYMYNYAKEKLQDNSNWSYSADMKGTGEVAILGMEYSNKNPVIGTIGSEWSRVSQTGWFSKPDFKTLVMYFDTTSSPLDIYIKLPKLETGNKATDWSPAPEDMATTVQFTSIEQTLKGVKITANNAVTQSQYTQLANQFTSTIGQITGVNLIPNSDFSQGSQYWHLGDNASIAAHGWKYTDGALILDHSDITKDTVIDILAKPYTDYTFSCNMYGTAHVYLIPMKDQAGGWTPVDDDYQDNFHTLTGTDESTPRQSFTLKRTSGQTRRLRLILRDEAGTTRSVFTKLQLEEGTSAHTWSPSTNGLATFSQFTQLQTDINLRVKTGDLINQINISPEGILIDGKKVHITGQTSIDNAVIKDAMIADIKADKITAGTLNAANVNVINLNANNITTGTIKGANLSMNLNTGEVVFQHGRIHSASNNVDVNIDQGYLSVANGNTRVLLKNGGIQFVQPTIFDEMTNPYLSISNGGSGLAFSGARIVGRDYVVMANNANSSNIFDSPLGGAESFAGISAGYDGSSWRPTKVGGAERGVLVSSGTPMSSAVTWVGSPPSIMVGYDSQGNMRGNRVHITGDYVHLHGVYQRSNGSSPNMVINSDGAVTRSTSASKYKADIIRTNQTSYGDKLLGLPTATWMDIAETKRYQDNPTTQPKPTRNFGMIAEDLADAGLEMLVVRGADGELEGINYDRIGPALIPVIAKLKNEVETLKQQLEEKTA